jgi:hypothetical protein
LSVVHEILGICAPPEVFGGRADSHHSLRHDGTIADKCEETVYKIRVSIVSDRLEWAEHVALGLSTRVRTGSPGLDPSIQKSPRLAFGCPATLDCGVKPGNDS